MKIKFLGLAAILAMTTISLFSCGDDDDNPWTVDVERVRSAAPGSWVVSMAYRNDKGKEVEPPRTDVNGAVITFAANNTNDYQVLVGDEVYDEGQYKIGTLYFVFNHNNKSKADTLQVADVDRQNYRTMQLNLVDSQHGTYLFTLQKLESVQRK